MNNKLKSFYPLIAVLSLWLVVYAETMISMVEFWWQNETFTHGFLIFPISFYLIWKKAPFFNLNLITPDRRFVALLFVLVLLWILADLVDVKVIKQFAFMLMVPVVVASLYGTQVLKLFLFPLFYLLFAVPTGEFLIPKLQYITAQMTIWGIHLTGIPVYTEGMFISIPTGDFEVAKACSGIRYLIASVALGTLYAYLFYQGVIKRTIFVIASFIVPIVANGMRAYGIVMIAHLSEMEYATGVDHLIYGWFFFGVVMFILFYIGSFWQDPEVTPPSVNQADAQSRGVTPSLALVGLMAILLLLGPLVTYWANDVPESPQTIQFTKPIVTSEWVSGEEKHPNWNPSFKNADAQAFYSFNRSAIDTLFVYMSHYEYEYPGKELINWNNEVYDINYWIPVAHRTFSQDINKTKYNMAEHVVIKGEEKLIIWAWYRVMGFNEANPIKVKIFQALSKLSGGSKGGTYFSMAAVVEKGDIESQRALLKSFLQENADALLMSLPQQ